MGISSSKAEKFKSSFNGVFMYANGACKRSKINNLEVNDERPWREILDGIVEDIGISSSKAEKFKSSVNGVVGYANGACKGSRIYNVDSVVSACIQRFKDREFHKELVNHQDFES